jgi:hypothetical protein
MIALAVYDFRSIFERLSRLRKAADFSERRSMLDERNQASRGGGEAASSRRFAPTAAREIATNGLPYTGSEAPIPESRSLAEQEWALDKAGAVKGGGAPSTAGMAGRLGGAASPVTSRGEPGASASALRSPLSAKAGIASGSQAAVVKIASFGSGPGRASSLLNYQSHKGELALEREDGSLVTGKAAIADLAAHWRGDDERGPSNDVFAFTMRFDGVVDDLEVRGALGLVLCGHKYVWRREESDGETAVHLVAVAAGARRDANGKLERIFANAKSEDRLFTKLETAFAREAEFSDIQWAHAVEGATSRLAALTKGGQFAAETEAGISVEAAADRAFAKKPSNANRPKSEGFNAALEIAKTWRPAMRSSAPRDFAHVILSAKPGTDQDAFIDAARATLAREFAGHEYVFVMHTNRQHIHVHAAVRLTHAGGKKLDPNIRDFARWRETLAEEARKRRIPMEATRRFDQAHAPAYKLKDVKMTERGHAPASVRRRVERVRNREIHHPTREEGRRRAAEAASHWKTLSARQSAPLPPLAPGATRLYRAETDLGQARRSPLFTVDRAVAETFAARDGTSRLFYLDVPAERLSELRPSREQPNSLFVVPPGLSALRQPVPQLNPAAIAPFSRRAQAALSRRVEDDLPSQNHLEVRNMRTAETMEAARKNMAEAMNRMGEFLPEGPDKDALMRRAAEILEKAKAATRAQEVLDRTPGEMSGEKHVEPKPRDFGGLFTHAQKGSEIHYSRLDPETGKLRALAFIDKGRQLEVRDWSNSETVNAALKLASEKWETITVTGSAAYKETAARLAAEHGYTITNPEMQERIRELRAEIDARRSAARNDEASPFAKPDAQDTRSGERQPNLNTTPAERAIELQSIRERVDAEAQRETRQANREQAAHETNAASGDQTTPSRTSPEARAAREAERSIDNNPSRLLPSDPNQSEAVQSLRHEQAQVLKRADEDRQRRIDAQNAERLRQRDEQRARGEIEGEGETR